jgi:PhoH-like ATPase
MTNKVPLDLSKLSEREFPFLKKLDRQQEDMVTKLFRSKRVVVDAVAGSGKTTVLTQAFKALLDKQRISAIYYVVFPVQEKALGYLPGGVAEKLQEYAVPFFQALTEAGVNPSELDLEDVFNVLTYGEFKVVPHTFLRGRNLDGVGILIDEPQNGTVEEIRKILTRVTDSCYVALAGHNGQIDIKKDNSGFSNYIHHFKTGKQSGEYSEIEFADLSVNYRGKFSSYSDKIGQLKTEEEDK